MNLNSFGSGLKRFTNVSSTRTTSVSALTAMTDVSPSGKLCVSTLLSNLTVAIGLQQMYEKLLSDE